MSVKKQIDGIEFFENAISIASEIIGELKQDDLKKKITSVERLTELPKLPRDDGSKKFKIYNEAKEIYKTLHKAVARGIMDIIDSTYTGVHDKMESFNYKSPEEPVAAVKAIKLLPNAFIGGPIKSAINSNDPFIQKIVIEYFETLPSDIRISDVFPKDYNLYIKKLKLTVLKRLENRE